MRERLYESLIQAFRQSQGRVQPWIRGAAAHLLSGSVFHMFAQSPSPSPFLKLAVDRNDFGSGEVLGLDRFSA